MAGGDTSYITPAYIERDSGVMRAKSAGGAAFTERFRVSTANVNAGLTLLAALPGIKYRVVDVTLIAIGGAASGATTVDILATQAAGSVKLVAAAVAGLTQSTLLRMGAANAAVLADGTSNAVCDVNTAVTIGKTGGSLATCTFVDVILTFVMEV